MAGSQLAMKGESLCKIVTLLENSLDDGTRTPAYTPAFPRTSSFPGFSWGSWERSRSWKLGLARPSGTFLTTPIGIRYPIQKGIPILLPSAAIMPTASQSSHLAPDSESDRITRCIASRTLRVHMKSSRHACRRNCILNCRHYLDLVPISEKLFDITIIGRL